MSVLSEITSESIQTADASSTEEEEKMAKIYAHAVDVSLSALEISTSTSDPALLEASLDFLSKIVVQNICPFNLRTKPHQKSWNELPSSLPFTLDPKPFLQA